MSLGDHGFLTCSACGRSKPPADFHRSTTEERGRQYVCKACQYERKREASAYRRLPPGDYVNSQFRLSVRNKQALKALAEEHGVTMSAIVNTAVERTLKASGAL